MLTGSFKSSSHRKSYQPSGIGRPFVAVRPAYESFVTTIEGDAPACQGLRQNDVLHVKYSLAPDAIETRRIARTSLVGQRLHQISMTVAVLRSLDASDRHGHLKRWSVLCGGEPKLLEHVCPGCHFQKPRTTLRCRVFFTESVWQCAAKLPGK